MKLSLLEEFFHEPRIAYVNKSRQLRLQIQKTNPVVTYPEFFEQTGTSMKLRKVPPWLALTGKIFKLCAS